jgi:glutamate-1-semialdehyde aminotransferase
MFNMKISGQELYKEGKKRIPGGTQLLSKRPEMFLPEHWPSYYSKAKGAEIWGLKNEKFVDMSYMGIGACILGYADPDVNKAVHKAIDSGSMTTLNCPEEVELAELLCELHPWAQMVRYARCGGESMTIAVRIARAYTGRDKVAFCGYHGWHDWYLASNLSDKKALDGHLLPGLAPAGVPRGLTGTALPFHYNNIEELETIVKNHGKDLAAIVMEPIRNHEPKPGFLERIRKIANKLGAVLIFDEITAGWRMNAGGIHLRYNVNPDIAVLGKAISNGYPMAAVIGVKDVMEAAQSSFISSTYWTERIGPVAAIATIKKFIRCNVAAHLNKVGEKVQEVWKTSASEAGIAITVSGIPPLGHFSFDYSEGEKIRTLFTQIMLEKGFLATNAFYASYAHKDKHINKYRRAVRDTFHVLSDIIKKGEIDKYLKGPVAHTGFARLT